MAVSWDGSLSSAEFYAAASAFSDLWRKFNSSLPPWTWACSPRNPWTSRNQEEGFLSVENVFLPKSFEEEHPEGNGMEKEECSCADGDESIDTVTLVQSHGEEHHYDFHIVYSSSYRVPALYFRAYFSDGQPLVLEDIKKDIPINHAEYLARSKWTFMTQEEHPLLNRPWYTLHPCGTSEWMKLLLGNDAFVAQDGKAVDKYLVSWFSVVGQVFGLKIPIEMLENSSLLSSDKR